MPCRIRAVERAKAGTYPVLTSQFPQSVHFVSNYRVPFQFPSIAPKSLTNRQIVDVDICSTRNNLHSYLKILNIYTQYPTLNHLQSLPCASLSLKYMRVYLFAVLSVILFHPMSS